MDVFTRLEDLEIPVVSLIDGFALGGGNELAMSTHYRIATENAMLGQPEVKLGIIPGYGGMQRLPRLVGPRKAAELAVNGEAVDGREAVRIGLVHELQPSCTALLRAFAVARELSADASTQRRPDWAALAASTRDDMSGLYETSEVTRLLASSAPTGSDARDIVAARSYAARLALEAMRAGYDKGFSAGLENDARLFGEVVSSESGQHWVGRFLAKDPEQSTFLTLLRP